jgi:hypothetical protein
MKNWLFALSLSLLLCLGLNFCPTPPAYALLRRIDEKPGQIVYQARNSLRDSRGGSWQVVLFKRLKNGERQSLHLRLVGFPEKNIFLHPESLTLTTSEGKVKQAPDVFTQKSPAANVGEYALEDILTEVVAAKYLKLSLPLQEPVSLTVPLSVLLEWQTLED